MRNAIHELAAFFQRSRLHQCVGITLVLWVVLQGILLLVFWGAPQSSDHGMYLQIALDSFMRNEWYPERRHLYDAFIWAPGYINYLVLQLKLFGTTDYNGCLNLAMNVAMVYQIYVLAEHFFSEKTALYSVLIYCALYSNSMVILTAGTEIPFMFLVISSFVIIVKNKRANHFLWVGLFLALANWIRPFVILFLPIFLAYMFWKKQVIGRYIHFCFGLVVGIVCIGFFTQFQIGTFSFQSTTSGNNLIQTAHDKAYGGIMTSYAADTSGTMYIHHPERYTVFQKDSIWKARSIEWIAQHPFRYTYLYVKKWGGLYLEDSWADRPLNGHQGSFNAYVDGNMSREVLHKRFFWMAVKSITYYITLVLFLWGLWKCRYEWRSPKVLLFLLILMGTGANSLFVVGPRYHYPYMFAIIMFAAAALAQIGNETTKNKRSC